MATSIRVARIEDAPTLGRMGAALAQQHHTFDPLRFMDAEGAESGYASWLAQEIRNRRAIVLVAEQEGEGVVGYAYGRLERVDWSTFRDACGEFQDLWVEPGARGNGLGARLAQAMFERFAALQTPRVILHVAAANAPARRLFARIGYRETMIEMTREIDEG